jgi:outer membrane protein assembly factor BamB/ribosomal protein L24
MKKQLILFCLFLISFSGYAQINYALTIKDTKRQPLPGIVVTATNTSTGSTITSTTDAAGTAAFELSEPGNYQFSYKDVENVASLEVLEGFTGNSSRTVTYDPKGLFAEKPKSDRSGISFRVVDGKTLKGKAKMAKVTVVVKDKDRVLVPGVNVTVVSIPGKVKFTGTSSREGEAVFYVPAGQRYEIDVENLEAFKVFDVPNFEGVEKIETVFYEKPKLVERVKGDTIVQSNVEQETGTPSHVLFTLELNDYEPKPLEGEPVYAKAMESNRVYEGVTDETGMVRLMLEKGHNYVLNLKYENGIHLIKAPHSKGFRTVSCGRRYRGSKAIEELQARQKAEMEALQERLRISMLRPGDEGYEISFEDTPVEKLDPPTDYITQTPEGMNIDFEESGLIATPTIVGNNLYTQKGWYSSDYYCLDARTGAFKWGLHLYEAGLSPAVYVNGIILINTESCSLYAIDAETGELLWSHYLSGYLYSTPTSDGESVYVVYKHGSYPVITSFDLRTGDFNWVQPVDDEAIACPVVDRGEVHVASQGGVYYVFDAKTGERTNISNEIFAITSPTLTEDKIYVTSGARNGNRLMVLDRKTLKVDKVYANLLSAHQILTDIPSIRVQMNFNGSHPVIYKNKIAIVNDLNGLKAFDLEAEKLLWQQSVQVGTEQLPLIADEKIIISATDGTVMAYDIMTGAPTVLKKASNEVVGQPVAKNGILYLATGGVLSIIKIADRFEWLQWNKDATHNTVFE